METISEQDAFFLVVLSASEESSMIELKWEFEKWDIGLVDVTHVIESLINQGDILLSKRNETGFSDYSKSDSIEISRTWAISESWETIIFLTEKGERRWETDYWGITTKRARYLMFSNKRTRHA